MPEDWFGEQGIDAARVAPFAHMLDARACHQRYGCDAHLALVNHLVPAMHAAHSWYALYGHTKQDEWKGFLELPLSECPEGADDRAVALLGTFGDP